MKLKSLTDTFLITNTPSTEETEEFDRHVLDHLYTLLWRSWRVWQARSWSPIPLPLRKLRSLTDPFLTTNTPSIEEAEEFDRHVLDHKYSLHWRNWRVWQTRSWSPKHPPLEKLNSFTDTFLIINNRSIKEVEEFDRHVLDHEYTLHWRRWSAWQTRSWSRIYHPLMKLESLTDTFLITNIQSIKEAEDFDRHVLDHLYTLHWRNWRSLQTRSWSPIHPPLKKLKTLTDTFLITCTHSIGGTEGVYRHVLDHQYTLHWRSWRVWQTRSSLPIHSALRELKSLTDTLLFTNTPSINEAEEFDRHVHDHEYTVH